MDVEVERAKNLWWRVSALRSKDNHRTELHALDSLTVKNVHELLNHPFGDWHHRAAPLPLDDPLSAGFRRAPSYSSMMDSVDFEGTAPTTPKAWEVMMKTVQPAEALPSYVPSSVDVALSPFRSPLASIRHSSQQTLPLIEGSMDNPMGGRRGAGEESAFPPLVRTMSSESDEYGVDLTNGAADDENDEDEEQEEASQRQPDKEEEEADAKGLDERGAVDEDGMDSSNGSSSFRRRRHRSSRERGLMFTPPSSPAITYNRRFNSTLPSLEEATELVPLPGASPGRLLTQVGGLLGESLAQRNADRVVEDGEDDDDDDQQPRRGCDRGRPRSGPMGCAQDRCGGDGDGGGGGDDLDQPHPDRARLRARSWNSTSSLLAADEASSDQQEQAQQDPARGGSNPARQPLPSIEGSIDRGGDGDGGGSSGGGVDKRRTFTKFHNHRDYALDSASAFLGSASSYLNLGALLTTSKESGGSSSGGEDLPASSSSSSRGFGSSLVRNMSSSGLKGLAAAADGAAEATHFKREPPLAPPAPVTASALGAAALAPPSPPHANSKTRRKGGSSLLMAWQHATSAHAPPRTETEDGAAASSAAAAAAALGHDDGEYGAYFLDAEEDQEEHEGNAEAVDSRLLSRSPSLLPPAVLSSSAPLLLRRNKTLSPGSAVGAVAAVSALKHKTGLLGSARDLLVSMHPGSGSPGAGPFRKRQGLGSAGIGAACGGSANSEEGAGLGAAARGTTSSASSAATTTTTTTPAAGEGADALKKQASDSKPSSSPKAEMSLAVLSPLINRKSLLMGTSGENVPLQPPSANTQNPWTLPRAIAACPLPLLAAFLPPPHPPHPPATTTTPLPPQGPMSRASSCPQSPPLLPPGTTTWPSSPPPHVQPAVHTSPSSVVDDDDFLGSLDLGPVLVLPVNEDKSSGDWRPRRMLLHQHMLFEYDDVGGGDYDYDDDGGDGGVIGEEGDEDGGSGGGSGDSCCEVTATEACSSGSESIGSVGSLEAAGALVSPLSTSPPRPPPQPTPPPLHHALHSTPRQRCQRPEGREGGNGVNKLTLEKHGRVEDSQGRGEEGAKQGAAEAAASWFHQRRPIGCAVLWGALVSEPHPLDPCVVELTFNVLPEPATSPAALSTAPPQWLSGQQRKVLIRFLQPRRCHQQHEAQQQKQQGQQQQRRMRRQRRRARRQEEGPANNSDPENNSKNLKTPVEASVSTRGGGGSGGSGSGGGVADLVVTMKPPPAPPPLSPAQSAAAWVARLRRRSHEGAAPPLTPSGALCTGGGGGGRVGSGSGSGSGSNTGWTVNHHYEFDDTLVTALSNQTSARAPLGVGRFSTVRCARRKRTARLPAGPANVGGANATANQRHQQQYDGGDSDGGGGGGGGGGGRVDSGGGRGRWCAVKVVEKREFWVRVWEGRERSDTLVREALTMAHLTRASEEAFTRVQQREQRLQMRRQKGEQQQQQQQRTRAHEQGQEEKGGRGEDDDAERLQLRRLSQFDGEDAVMRTVPLLGLVESFQSLGIEMALMSSADLFDRLAAHGPLSEVAASAIARELLLAVSFLQRNGVAHRDVKLANITFPKGSDPALVMAPPCDDDDGRQEDDNGCDGGKRSGSSCGSGESKSLNSRRRSRKPQGTVRGKQRRVGRVVLADFGMAAFEDPRDGLVRGRCGTPGYVAPEILKAGVMEGYRNAVDVFSVGAVVYALLCGYEPFYGETDAELKLANEEAEVVFHGDGSPWEQVGDSAKELVVALLCADPAHRPTPAQALAHPWLRCEEGDGEDGDDDDQQQQRSHVLPAVATATHTPTATSLPFPAATTIATDSVGSGDSSRRGRQDGDDAVPFPAAAAAAAAAEASLGGELIHPPDLSEGLGESAAFSSNPIIAGNADDDACYGSGGARNSSEASNNRLHEEFAESILTELPRWSISSRAEGGSIGRSSSSGVACEEEEGGAAGAARVSTVGSECSASGDEGEWARRPWRGDSLDDADDTGNTYAAVMLRVHSQEGGQAASNLLAPTRSLSSSSSGEHRQNQASKLSSKPREGCVMC